MVEKKSTKKAAAKKPEAKKAPAKKKDEAPKVVVFRSREPEVREFVVHGFKARRCDAPGYCEWHIPAEQAEAFASHPHVMRGRIIRQNG